MEDSGKPRQTDSSRDEIPTSPVSDDIWKLILDRQHVALDMINMLKGVSYIVKRDEKTGRVYGEYVRTGVPVMNEKGINFFSPMFYASMSPDKLTTNISDSEVSIMMREMMYSVIDVIAEMGDDFGIAASNRSFVLLQIEHFYFMALTASRRGTILNALKPTFRREETYTPQKKEHRGWNPLTFLSPGRGGQ